MSYILPIQEPFIQIIATPLHIDWPFNPPTPDQVEGQARISLIVLDGQNNLIRNQKIRFTGTLGMPIDGETDNDGDAFTESSDEHGEILKIWEFAQAECPAPPPTPGSTTATITAQIEGVQYMDNVTLVLMRYE